MYFQKQNLGHRDDWVCREGWAVGRGPGQGPCLSTASPLLQTWHLGCSSAREWAQLRPDAPGLMGGAGAQTPHVESLPLPEPPPKPRRQLPLLRSWPAIILLDCSLIGQITGHCGDHLVCMGPRPAVEGLLSGCHLPHALSLSAGAPSSEVDRTQPGPVVAKWGGVYLCPGSGSQQPCVSSQP